MFTKLLNIIDRLAMHWIDRRMAQQAEELQKQPGFEAVQPHKAHFDEDGWSVEMVHESVAILAAGAAEMLNKNNAKNYVQVVMYPKLAMQPVEVTVRWYWGGLTPAEKNTQLQKELDEANRDADCLAAFLDTQIKFIKDAGYGVVPEIKAALADHAKRREPHVA